MKGILFPVVIFALTLTVISGDKEGEKAMDQVLKLAELLKNAKPEKSSSAKIRQNTGISCLWYAPNYDAPKKFSCEEAQSRLESKDYAKFKKLCPRGNFDMCMKGKLDSDGSIVRSCACSRSMDHNTCFNDRDGRICTCSDKDYCNSGNDFDSSSGRYFPSALATTTLVLLGFFGPSFF